MTVSVLANWLAVYTRVPSGCTAIPKGASPTRTLATLWSAVLMTDTVSEPQLATYTRAPSGCAATPKGLSPTGTLVTMGFAAGAILGARSITVTLSSKEFVTYAYGAACAPVATPRRMPRKVPRNPRVLMGASPCGGWLADAGQLRPGLRASPVSTGARSHACGANQVPPPKGPSNRATA